MKSKQIILSVVVPVYNEAQGIQQFYASLQKVLTGLGLPYEIIFVNDGSSDGSKVKLQAIAQGDQTVRLLNLSRNFGKEVATTAGIHHATGEATLLIDADGQHPVEKISDFVRAWKQGAKVVIGLRQQNSGEGPIKRYGSRVFHAIFNRFSTVKIPYGSTDFRLIDRQVREVFTELTEHNRMTRGLIDWLGFERAYIPFVAKARVDDKSGYTIRKLSKLAVDSVISLSNAPLYFAAYVGAFITFLATAAGIGMVINLLLDDPLALHARGSAYALVLVLLLAGIILVFQGILGIYMSHIHTETKNRPLYIIEKDKSKA